MTPTPSQPSPARTEASAVTVACCQLAPQVGRVPENRKQIREAVLSAAGRGANVVVLPELANSGYVFDDLEELRSAAEPVDGETIREWEALASRLRLVIVSGFAELGTDGQVHNASVLIDETGLRAVYRKAHLWNAEKTRGFTPGAAPPPVVDTPYGRIGMMICYDLEFPEWVRRAALEGAELLCGPVNWPLYPRPEGERPGEIVRVQADASVNRMFVAVADRTGVERGQDWLGGSVIVDADGYPVTALCLGEATIVTATLDLAEARDKSISELNDVHADRRPGLYAGVGPEQP
ncbi:nitrilase-related carbon-nitrogen hydrolase [Streptomyces cathayae]|uniref:Nitrilase-related carbon-nitrogen hydrolase n=1 Tax=Streptomyces cathayae TaxID=3031124 RepID=A0ABY8JWA4_9ACTN|nr:nitrilase-related carbon-nitrogen hydrolase [Streptomyces sp. HUAS 5]WGD40279.1 nitrilase-related carbon-nitrogen hydrolase [Streptomyces sp. HUAS 5]